MKTKAKHHDREMEKNAAQAASETSRPPEGQSPATEDVRAYIERIQRLQAEFENYKKRAQKDLAAAEERIIDGIILDFLPLYDNMQRAFDAFADDRNTDALVAGMEQIFAQFGQILAQKDVSRVNAVGEVFDPALHEAMLGVESDETKNTILEEFSPGYTRNGRVLRASKVTVSRGPTGVEEDKE